MIAQGTPEWQALRCGKVTASRVADIMARTKTGPSASRANYMAELVCQRLTGVVAEGFTSAEMRWGTEQEPAAREAYEFQTGEFVDQVAFVVHPRIPQAGASPDGHVGTDGMVEIKAPSTATHLDTLLNRTIPDRYQSQMLWQMACTGRAYCDFVSFDPRLPEHLQLFVQRFPRDDARIALMEAEVTAFIADLDTKIAALAEAYPLAEAA